VARGTDWPARTYRVTFELPAGEVRDVPAAADEYVLTAGRRAGLELPSVCEVGWDLACAVRVLSGKLDHSDARRYFDADREAGFALICRARPLSDLRLRTHQAKAMRDFRIAHHLPAPRGVG
jgi:ferredoxin